MLIRISDVGRLIDEPPSVLRHWQRELRIPVMRTPGKQRYFLQRDVARLRLAKQLIRREGYTLAGARDRIRQLEEWR